MLQVTRDFHAEAQRDIVASTSSADEDVLYVQAQRITEDVQDCKYPL